MPNSPIIFDLMPQDRSGAEMEFAAELVCEVKRKHAGPPVPEDADPPVG